jgi:hypothetical protein
MTTNKPTSQQIAQALLNKLSLLASNKQQLIAKHEASLRALRLVQADRSEINNKKGAK